jgi:hypothetical protein
VASPQRQNIQDSDAGYPEAGCGGGLNAGKAMAAKPTSSQKSPPTPPPRADWPGQQAHDQLRISCHVMPFPPALLHEQVSERKFRTGRKPRSI